VKLAVGDQSAYRLLLLYCVLMSLAVFLWNSLTDIVFLLMLLNCLVAVYYRKNLAFDTFVVWLLFFGGYSLLTVVWSGNTSYAVSTNVSIIQRIVLAICVYIIADSKERVRAVIQCIFLGGIFVLAYMFVVYGFSGIVKYLNSESGIRLGTEITNVNTIGSSLTMAGISAWFFLFRAKRRILYLLSFLIFFLFIIASGSRTALLGLAIGMVSVSYFSSKKAKIFKVLLAVLALIALYFVIKKMGWMPRIVERFDAAFASIFGGEEFKGSARSRIEFAEYGIGKIVKNPLFGYGAGQFRYYMGIERGMAYSSHNNYIEVLFSYGLIGLVAWYGMFAYCIKKLWKVRNKDNNPVIIALLLMRAAMDVSGHSVATSIPYLLLALAFACVRNEIHENRNALLMEDSVSKPNSMFNWTNGNGHSI